MRCRSRYGRRPFTLGWFAVICCAVGVGCKQGAVGSPAEYWIAAVSKRYVEMDRLEAFGSIECSVTKDRRVSTYRSQLRCVVQRADNAILPVLRGAAGSQYRLSDCLRAEITGASIGGASTITAELGLRRASNGRVIGPIAVLRLNPNTPDEEVLVSDGLREPYYLEIGLVQFLFGFLPGGKRTGELRMFARTPTSGLAWLAVRDGRFVVLTGQMESDGTEYTLVVDPAEHTVVRYEWRLIHANEPSDAIHYVLRLQKQRVQ